MSRDPSDTLEYLELRVRSSPAASARWAACTGEQLQPLVEWVCQPRTAWVQRRRACEAVELLGAPDLGPPSVGMGDLLFPPLAGPSWLDALLRR